MRTRYISTTLSSPSFSSSSSLPLGGFRRSEGESRREGPSMEGNRQYSSSLPSSSPSSSSSLVMKTSSSVVQSLSSSFQMVTLGLYFFFFFFLLGGGGKEGEVRGDFKKDHFYFISFHFIFVFS